MNVILIFLSLLIYSALSFSANSLSDISLSDALGQAVTTILARSIVALLLFKLITYKLTKKTTFKPLDNGRWVGGWLMGISVITFQSFNKSDADFYFGIILVSISWFLLGLMLGYIWRKLKPLKVSDSNTIKSKDISSTSPQKLNNQIDYWEQVSKEFNSGQRKEGLWAKCFADVEGDENKAKALYLKYRFEQLVNDSENNSKIKEQPNSTKEKELKKSANGDSIFKAIIPIAVIFLVFTIALFLFFNSYIKPKGFLFEEAAKPVSNLNNGNFSFEEASKPQANALNNNKLDGEIVKIGHAAPLTGPIAHLGKDNENGARLAIEEINKSGLVINGKKVQLVLSTADDKEDPITAVQVAQKLVNDGVIGVVGHLNSGTSIPASKVYSDAGITQISPSATDPEYTKQGYKTTFRLTGGDDLQAPALAKYAFSTLHNKTVFIIEDGTQYGVSTAQEFEKSAKRLGMTVLGNRRVSNRSTEFGTLLLDIRKLNPDLIMFGGMDSVAGPLAKQAKEISISAKIIGPDGICTENISVLAGSAAENIICSESGTPLSKMAHGREFQKRYKERFNTDVQIYSPFTYDAVYVLVDSMKRANSTSTKDILASMRNSNINGLTGPISFDLHGNLRKSTISIYNYPNGQKTPTGLISM